MSDALCSSLKSWKSGDGEVESTALTVSDNDMSCGWTSKRPAEGLRFKTGGGSDAD